MQDLETVVIIVLYSVVTTSQDPRASKGDRLLLYCSVDRGMTGVIRIRWQVPRVLPTATRNGPSLAREKFSELKGTHPFQILSSFLSLTTPKKGFNSISSPLPHPSSHTMAAVTAPKDTPKSGLALYSRFAFAGAVCCSVTHGAVTPLDV